MNKTTRDESYPLVESKDEGLVGESVLNNNTSHQCNSVRDPHGESDTP